MTILSTTSKTFAAGKIQKVKVHCNISAELFLKMGNICSSCCEKGKYTAIGVNESENFHNDPGAQFNAMLGLVFVV
jgi:hypothetical protein